MKQCLTTVAAFAFASAALAMPPVFSDLSFEKAKTQAAAEGKLLIVDGTAEWCGPCKQMDRTTWVDEDVVAWIEASAIAIQVDVDHQPDTAKELSITAMPTIIAFRAEDEIDRFVGYRDAEFTLDWLNRVESGKTETDRLRELAGDRAGEGGKIDVQARLELARHLLHNRKLDEALEEYVWLWDHMLEFQPSMIGVRGSFMANEMWRLAVAHPPAKQRFTEMRDALEDRLHAGDADYKDLDDWVVLCEVIGDERSVIDWVERIKDRSNAAAAFDRVGFRLTKLLMEHERWKLLGEVIRDPAAKSRQSLAVLDHTVVSDAVLEHLTTDQRKKLREQMIRMQLEEILKYHAASLAVHKLDAAQDIADLLLDRDDSPWMRIQLAEYAARAGVALPRHLEWLDEAAEAGEDVGDLQERVAAIVVEPDVVAAKP